ncbi:MULTISPECIES: universal stress protein [Streptomyces]|uniref:Universal stress protein n=1 Tax=Streptomyces morookaense TaxID=1970 RepID=A0A7Y7B0B1_STRMO|nr:MULTISPECIES: universal stress protein [Streptomyces]MCC2274296.1 universal stress protein [Streptomyces sp. ET3-23]NVK76627.1 universal stress protein [Streptomyces morookaense]
MEPAPITAGLDGSPESLAAAHWAAGEADRRGATLRLLHAWILLVAQPRNVAREDDQDYWAKRLVRAAHTEVQARRPGLHIVDELVAGDPATVLLKAAGESTMTVLGSRGLDRVSSFFLGDVALHVAGRAERPVVLVRAGAHGEHPAPSPGSGVVVGAGLHGPGGDEVLGFAFGAADGRGVPLTAVHGLSLPVQAYAPWGVDPDVAEELSHDARQQLAAALRPWRATYPDLPVTGTVRLESPARAVVRAAEGAGLVVVGRRRHRTALTPRLGAVVQACVHHASCPVAVVPHD